MASKGGKASGEARRKKADFRKTLNALLTAKIDNPEWTPVLEALGLDCTLESALNMAMIKEGLAGNVKAFEAIARYSGQTDRTDHDLEEQQIKIDRDKRARDQETGNNDDSEGIQSFVDAMNPEPGDMAHLFDDDEEVEDDAEETEEAGDI